MILSSAAVSAAVVGASRPHFRAQDALGTAGKMPTLLGLICDPFLNERSLPATNVARL
jgi:hypothetical protein